MWYEDLNTLVISMYPSTHSPIFPSTNQHPSIHPFINWILRDLNVNSDSDWFIFVHLWFIVKWHHPKNQLRSETHTRLFSLCHINVFQWERPGIWFPWIQTVYQIHMSNSNSSQIQRMKPNRRPEPSVRLSTPAGTSPSPCESWFVCVCVNDVNKKEVKKKNMPEWNSNEFDCVFVTVHHFSRPWESVQLLSSDFPAFFSVCSRNRVVAKSLRSIHWISLLKGLHQDNVTKEMVIVFETPWNTEQYSHREEQRTQNIVDVTQNWTSLQNFWKMSERVRDLQQHNTKGQTGFFLTASDDTVLLTSTSWCPRLRD